MNELTSTIKSTYQTIPRKVRQTIQAFVNIPNATMDSINGNISRLNVLSKTLDTSDKYFNAWNADLRGKNQNNPATNRTKRKLAARPHKSVSGPRQREFLDATFQLMDQAAPFSEFSEIKNMGSTLRNMNKRGLLTYDRSLKGSGTFFTFNKKVHMSEEFLQKFNHTDQKTYALVVNAGIMAHEATHSHYGITDEKPLRGKLSPPRVGLETMRSIRDLYRSRGDTPAIEMSNYAIEDYIKGARKDGFTPKEFKSRIIKQPIRRQRS